MSNQRSNKRQFVINTGGFSLPELLIVLIIAAIIAVYAIPQIISSKRLISFSAMKQQVSTVIRETRQDAISQRKPISLRYDDSTKEIVISGGKYGIPGATTNRIIALSSGGMFDGDIIYGRPSGVAAAPLGDSTTETNLTAGVIDITFQGDGSVRDASDNPADNALYFYHNVLGKNSAFAVSILGSSGRVKIWTYSPSSGTYVE